MKIKEFIENNCINIQKWCDKHQLCKGTIYKMLRNENYIPAFRVAYRIIEATNEVVTFKDIYPDKIPKDLE